MKSSIRGRLWRYRLPAALIGAAAVIALVVTVSVAPTAHSTPVAPPAWLTALAQQAARNCSDASPTAAEYALTTYGDAAPAVGLVASNLSNATQAMYLVVLTGNFTWVNASRPPSVIAPPTGTTIAFTVNPRTHGIQDFGLSKGSVDTSAVGDMTAFSW